MTPYSRFTPVALIAAVLLISGAVHAASAEGLFVRPQVPRSLARAALADLSKEFWVGTSASGHLRLDAHEERPDHGGWEQAQASMAYYWAWKCLGDRQAGQRVAAEWTWTKQHAADLNALCLCGHGATLNFESDDTGWNTGFYLAAYEVTGDPIALQAAEGSLDCAWLTWWDTSNGGYWYNTKHSSKAMYQAVLTLDNEWTYRLTHSATYHQRAIQGERWVVEHLRREDGLYWKGMDQTGRVPEERLRYMINPSQSVTMIVGNMAQAVAEVWLFEDTHEAVYLQQAQTTADAIRRYEVDKGGVLINDQDCYTDGYAMEAFAHEVLPKLSAADRAAWRDTFWKSATTIWRVDHFEDGTFGADWGGPPKGICWTRKTDPPAPSSKVSISGGAVDVIVAAAVMGS